jgi:hypothetical protein
LEGQLEEAFIADLVHRVLVVWLVRLDHPDLFGSWDECANDDGLPFAGFVHAEKGEGIGVVSAGYEVNV